MPTLEPIFVFHRLVQDEQALDSVVADRRLEREAFVERHRCTIERHYAAEGRHLEEATTRQLADELWGYLQYLMSLTQQPEDEAPEVG